MSTMFLRTCLEGRAFRRMAALIVAAAWCGAVLLLWRFMLEHAYQPGKSPSDEAKAQLEASNDFRIVLFAHPFCPCTRATLNELSESLARMPKSVNACVVFTVAGLKEQDVAKSSLVELARAIPGVTVRFDDTGHEAQRFGATVSGEAFAFGQHGQLVYHGGLTPARGHQGDAPGQAQLELLAKGVGQDLCRTPIYGCRLPACQTPKTATSPPEG